MNKPRSLLAGIALGVCWFAYAGESNAVHSEATALAREMQSISEQIAGKWHVGKATAESLAPELQAMDALLAKQQEKSDDAAQVALMKANVFLYEIGDEEMTRTLLTRLVSDYPGTRTARTATGLIDNLSPTRKAKFQALIDTQHADEAARSARLVGKPAPELDFIWSTRADLGKLTDLKGHVVVLDFWATWCAPCIRSFPIIREETAYFKAAPVVFLGVTSLQGRVQGLPGGKVITEGDPQKEFSLMSDFIKAKSITWNLALSSQRVLNPDYGIRAIPFVVIIDPTGVIRHAGIDPLDPQAEIRGKITALLREFNLPIPGPNN